MSQWRFLKKIFKVIVHTERPGIYVGRHPATVPGHSLIFFPLASHTFFCGLAGIVTFKKKSEKKDGIATESLSNFAAEIKRKNSAQCLGAELLLKEDYLCGQEAVENFLESIRELKQDQPLYEIFARPEVQSELEGLAERLSEIIAEEQRFVGENMGRLPAESVQTMIRRIDVLKDAAWCLSVEILGNVPKLRMLIGTEKAATFESFRIFKKINAVLNSIDRLEVRGRDSAGLSVIFDLDETAYDRFIAEIERKGLIGSLEGRSNRPVLVNDCIDIHKHLEPGGKPHYGIALIYKVAAEIGSLGDNVAFLRQQVAKDAILHALADTPHRYYTVSSHTRWASVGAITEANCHPVDNKFADGFSAETGIIHACLNGDIDNYLELKTEIENQNRRLHEDVTTDTKIIPLQVEKYLRKGCDLTEAFRRAANDFEGSHAICIHSNLAPGKLFLAQKGSGQAVFVGIAEDHFVSSSEIYGLVEETPHYIKLDGEKVVEGEKGKTQGQIVVLSQETAGGLAGIHAMYYDGTPIALSPADIKKTEITSRDIDRQDFQHYFLKEISESPDSVEKTLQNRWKVRESDGKKRYVIELDETVVPETLEKALSGSDPKVKKIRHICFVGQGTAGVAALACANIVEHYLDDPDIQVSAMKSSELSGFKLSDSRKGGMSDVLVIAISQSGTTTDTNRTVDMVRERGAHTLAIVNRRDSDLTFKVDGVMYTSSGRDIEMSVASTKAFYSQIVAGALLGLHLCARKGRRSEKFIADEIKQLLELPGHMRKILEMRGFIEQSARRLAAGKTYWAAVGSGPNKSSADEIRIKLSELCYKTISSDFIEDKKHIDLSAEPLIIVCAAGTRGTVIGDIVKDTAIFHAHKATPIVIADEGEKRFDPYAEDVFHVPVVARHLAPIVNTLVGHLWGYYAALTINEGSRFLYRFRTDLQETVAAYASQGLDLTEIVLEKSFREKVVLFYSEFRRKNGQKHLSATLGVEAASDLTLLLKYLAGKLPASDFDLDFGKKGTAANMLNTLLVCLSHSINQMARPVDAIKHQAKTVTVGTSRVSEKLGGILFDTLKSFGFSHEQVINRNILVLKNLQQIISRINGTTLYKISGLNLLGEPTEDSVIEVVKKEGTSAAIPSRVEVDHRLKGTKQIIVRQGNVYIGKGIKDGRSILMIPIISASAQASNAIEHLLLLGIAFKDSVPLPAKIKALGGKFDHIKSIVQENNVPWQDALIDQVAMDELFGRSAEKIGEFIVSKESAIRQSA